jgi:pumilio RNA-binding family
VIELCKDQYGNYVVQLMLEKGHRTNDRKAICNCLLGDARLLSIHKYASNVVEKCIEYCEEEDKRLLIEELLGDNNSDSAEENMSLYKMMDNKYGNYVVQKAIEQAT